MIDDYIAMKLWFDCIMYVKSGMWNVTGGWMNLSVAIAIICLHLSFATI